MKAAVLVQPGRPLVIEEGIEMPALEPGQVLVRMHYAGICHSQLMEVTGRRGSDPWLPHLLGHEAAGLVADTGPGVSKVRPGDAVILTWIRAGGMDVSGAQYTHHGKRINSGPVTVFSDYSIVSENRCVRMPAGLPADVASLFGCAVMTGAGMVVNTLRPAPGSSMAVLGLGGIGLCALLAARQLGCAPIIGVDIETEKLDHAKRLGATHLVDARAGKAVERIRELTGGHGADYCVEATGRARGIEEAFMSVRRGGGRCVFASHPPHGEMVHLDPFEMICGRHIQGSWGGDSRPDEDIPRYATWLLDGTFPVADLITHRYRLEQINVAFEDMQARRVGRALIEFDS